MSEEQRMDISVEHFAVRRTVELVALKVDCSGTGLGNGGGGAVEISSFDSRSSLSGIEK